MEDNTKVKKMLVMTLTETGFRGKELGTGEIFSVKTRNWENLPGS